MPNSRREPLLDTLSEIKASLQLNAEVMADTRDRIMRVEIAIENLEREMRGGVSPLPVRVSLLEEKIQGIDLSQANNRLLRWQVWVAIITAIIGPALVGLVLYLVSKG